MLAGIITAVLITAILIYTLIRSNSPNEYDNTGQEEFDRRMKEKYPNWKGL